MGFIDLDEDALREEGHCEGTIAYMKDHLAGQEMWKQECLLIAIKEAVALGNKRVLH